MSKERRMIIKRLESQIGEWYLTYILAHLTDCFDEYTKEGDKNLRSISFVFNDYFKYPLDLNVKENPHNKQKEEEK